MLRRLLHIIPVILISFVVLPTAAQEATLEPETEQVITATTLANANVRSEPKSGAGLVISVRSGTRLVVLEVISSGEEVQGNPVWYHVQLQDGSEGYVWSNLVSELETCTRIIDKTGWTEAISSTLETFHGEPTESIKQIYANYIAPENLVWQMDGLYDGIPVVELIEVRGKNNELLFTSLVTLRVYYLDKCGGLQSILVPYLVQAANGGWTVIDSRQQPDANPNPPITHFNSATMVETLKKDFKLVRGSLISVAIDYEAFYRIIGFSDDEPWFRKYLDSYYSVHGEELKAFEEKGDPSLGILLGADVAVYDPTVELPEVNN